jgi:hypothetical protein
MKLVIFDGDIYQLSDGAYDVALRLIAAGQWVSLDMEALGECLGTVDADLTDMQADEAERCLSDT